MKFISALALVVFLLSCNCEDKATKTPENSKVVQSLFEHFNKHDWKGMADIYADSVEMRDPSMGTSVATLKRAQIQSNYEQLGKMFPDVKDSVTNMYSSGDRHVITEFISTATDSTGKKFQLPVCTIFTIENGLITKDFTYYDNF